MEQGFQGDVVAGLSRLAAAAADMSTRAEVEDIKSQISSANFHSGKLAISARGVRENIEALRKFPEMAAQVYLLIRKLSEAKAARSNDIVEQINGSLGRILSAVDVLILSLENQVGSPIKGLSLRRASRAIKKIKGAVPTSHPHAVTAKAAVEAISAINERHSVLVDTHLDLKALAAHLQAAISGLGVVALNGKDVRAFLSPDDH